MLGSAVHNRLNALYVGLESLVAATMRMGNLNTKGYTLAAYFTFRHDSTPPYQANRRDRKTASIIQSKFLRDLLRNNYFNIGIIEKQVFFLEKTKHFI